VKKILLIRFSSIGDIVLTTLALRCLRNTFPNAQVDFLTKIEYKDLVSKHLRVDDVLVLKGSLLETSKEIVHRDYDFVVDFHSNLRSKALVQLLPERIKVFKYKKQTLRRAVSVWLGKDLYRGGKVPEQYLQALSSLGVEHDRQGLEFEIPKSDHVYRGDVPMTHQSGYVVIALGATYFTKRLPLNKWKEICQKIELPIILIGGDGEVELGEQLASYDDLKVVNRCGQYSIGQSASVMEQALFVVTQDSGMMHIAAALKKKIISIWGGTVPYLGFEPYGLNDQQSIIIENRQLSCRPCSKYGRSSCPKGHFKCMKDIDVQEVGRAVRQI